MAIYATTITQRRLKTNVTEGYVFLPTCNVLNQLN